MFFGVVHGVLSSFEINLPRKSDMISLLHCNVAVTWLLLCCVFFHGAVGRFMIVSLKQCSYRHK